MPEGDTQRAHLLEALRTKALVEFYQARYGAARALLDEMMEIYDPARHTVHAYQYGAEPAAVALSYLAWMDSISGEQTLSRSRLDFALEQANAAGHAFSICYVHCFAACMRPIVGKPAARRCVRG